MIHIVKLNTKQEVIDIIKSFNYDDGIRYILNSVKIEDMDYVEINIKLSGLHYFTAKDDLTFIEEGYYGAIHISDESDNYGDSYKWYYTVMLNKVIPFLRNKKIEELGI